MATDRDSELANVLAELSVAEEELRAQNEALLSANDLIDQERQHYINLFDTLADAYVITDSVGVIHEANPASAELFNIELRRLHGKPITVFVHDSDKRRVRSIMHETAREIRPFDFEINLRPRQQPEKAVSVRVSKINTSPARLGWLMRDLSSRAEVNRYAHLVEVEQNARYAAEDAARRFRFLAEVGRLLSTGKDRVSICGEVARAVVRFAADHCAFYMIERGELVAVAGADHDRARAEHVRALKRRHHLEPGEADGAIWRTLRSGEPQTIPPTARVSGRQPWKALFDEVKETGARTAIVLPLMHRDHCFGAMLVISAAPVPTLDAKEIGVLLEVAGRVGLALDNAELVEKLQIANTEKSEFLAVLSHELRTPLTAVIGYAELLLDGIPDELEGTAREHVERIQSSAWHQLSIVEQLLSHARPGVSEDVVNIETVDLADTVHQVVELVAPAAREKNIKLVVDVPAVLSLQTDPGRLRQILINLLWNAVKYTSRGSVEVHVRGSDEDVFLSVTDTGPGISGDALQHIFDAYWRGNDTGPGVGLGLSVSRKLATLLGGELTVESELGAGSTFTLRLRTE